MIMINVIPGSTVSFEKKKIKNEKNVYVLNGYQIRSPTTSTSVSQMRSPTHTSCQRTQIKVLFEKDKRAGRALEKVRRYKPMHS